MIDLIERIGPIVGIGAFLGLAVLAFLIFQQAREVRRLREWAGRAPERAQEAADASHAAAEARGEASDDAGEARGGRLRAFGHRLTTPVRPLWERLDRNSPLDPVYLVVLVLAAVVAAGVLTSGFGLVGGDDGRGERAGGGQGQGGERQQRAPQQVAVLNATQVEADNGTVIQGEPGLANEVADRVVRPAAGFRSGTRDNAASGFPETQIMFEPGARQDAQRLAGAIEATLGAVPVEPMIQEVRDLAGGARLALVVGQDDADF